MHRLFVYGTLGPGRPNEHVLKKIGGSWRKGFLWGKLYQEGWGMEMGYPGIRLEEKIEKIQGHVFSSDRLEEYWAELDLFEGKEYSRVKASITLEGEQREVEAFIYVLKEK